MIFLTGGTGLVGSHILLQLSKMGISCRALKREKSSLEICKRVFHYYKQENLFKNIAWVEGDINDVSSLFSAMQGCTKVIHAAALVSFLPSESELIRKVNIEGTANVVNTALSLEIKKFGYISSIAALGRNTTDTIVDENCHFIPSKNESNYALSKYYAEQEVWRGSEEGLDVVIVNPTIILGPGDWTKGSSQIFEKIYNGLRFYTNGSTGYVDVLDVARSIIELIQSEVRNERFIVNGINLKYRDAFNHIADVFGKPHANIRVGPFLKEIAWRAEMVRSFFTGKNPLITRETSNSAMNKSAFNSKKLERVLNFKFIPFKKTINKYCAWYQNDLL